MVSWASPRLARENASIGLFSDRCSGLLLLLPNVSISVVGVKTRVRFVPAVVSVGIRGDVWNLVLARKNAIVASGLWTGMCWGCCCCCFSACGLLLLFFLVRVLLVAAASLVTMVGVGDRASCGCWVDTRREHFFSVSVCCVWFSACGVNVDVEVVAGVFFPLFLVGSCVCLSFVLLFCLRVVRLFYIYI